MESAVIDLDCASRRLSACAAAAFPGVLGGRAAAREAARHGLLAVNGHTVLDDARLLRAADVVRLAPRAADALRDRVEDFADGVAPSARRVAVAPRGRPPPPSGAAAVGDEAHAPCVLSLSSLSPPLLARSSPR